jgi:hypothetical protein
MDHYQLVIAQSLYLPLGIDTSSIPWIFTVMAPNSAIQFS